MNLTIKSYEKIVESIYSRSLICLESDVQTKQVLIGVDPGTRNLGITTYFENTIILNQIKMNPEKDSIQSMINIMEMVKGCIPYKTNFGIAVTEGADYGSKFGQVSLGESRAAIMITLRELGFSVKKMAPVQIRKLATGKGTEKCLGLEFPPDATASFLACLVALQLDESSPQHSPS